MREAFRRLLPWIRDGVWIIASLRESALEKSSVDVYMDIARSLKRRGLMRQDWPGPDWNADKAGRNAPSIAGRTFSDQVLPGSDITGTGVGKCRFIPTCSEYTAEAVEKYGLIYGAELGLRGYCAAVHGIREDTTLCPDRKN